MLRTIDTKRIINLSVQILDEVVDISILKTTTKDEFEEKVEITAHAALEDKSVFSLTTPETFTCSTTDNAANKIRALSTAIDIAIKRIVGEIYLYLNSKREGIAKTNLTFIEYI